MPQRAPFLSRPTLGCPLIQVLHCRRRASLLVKSLEHWARKTNTRLFLDCSLTPTNWCHVGMLYPVEPELLIIRNLHADFYIKYLYFLRSLPWPSKKKVCLWPRFGSKITHLQPLSQEKKWICIIFGEYRNPKILIYGQRIQLDPIHI